MSALEEEVQAAVSKPGRAPSARELTRRLASLESSLKTAVATDDIELEMDLDGADEGSSATRAQQVYGVTYLNQLAPATEVRLTVFERCAQLFQATSFSCGSWLPRSMGD
jgi:hypothetical protein